MIETTKILNIAIYTMVITLGASLGSFFALIVYRMPLGQSIVFPGSYCASCNNKIKAWHKIPLLSWIVLRGKCAYCRSSIAMRSFFFEVLFALMALALFMRFGFSFSLLEKYLFASLLISIAYIDLDTFYIPNILIVFLVVLALLSSLYFYIWPEQYYPISEMPWLLKNFSFKQSHSFSLSNRFLGAGVGFLGMWLLNISMTVFLRKSGRLTDLQWAMGAGDPLFVMAIGLFVGLSHLALIIFLASFLGSIYGIFISFSKKQKNNNAPDIAYGAVPFGPFLSVAAIYVYLS